MGYPETHAKLNDITIRGFLRSCPKAQGKRLVMILPAKMPEELERVVHQAMGYVSLARHVVDHDSIWFGEVVDQTECIVLIGDVLGRSAIYNDVLRVL